MWYINTLVCYILLTKCTRRGVVEGDGYILWGLLKKKTSQIDP